MTTFKDATIAAASTSTSTSEYKQQTSFLISFGFTKALSNLVVGRVSDVYGRKLPHLLGWVAGIVLGVMLLLTEARSNTTTTSNWSNWTLYVLANVFLGAQQGWTWTTNIFMWMDILGPDHRALASGISNSVGYLSSAFATYMAATLSIRSAFWVVLASSVLGLAISVLLVDDTTPFVTKEIQRQEVVVSGALDDDDSDEEWVNMEMTEPATACSVNNEQKGNSNTATTTSNRSKTLRQSGYDLIAPSENNAEGASSSLDKQQLVTTASPSSFGTVFVMTCWQNKSTAVLCLGGLMANLVTSLAWGLVLIWGHQQSLSEYQLANIGSAFTFSKAIAMVLSAQISDASHNRKRVLLCGFVVTILGLVVTSMADDSHPHGTTSTSTNDNNNSSRIYICLLVGGMIIGSGIGSVYCVMTGAIGDHTIPQNRASAIGVYKLWRDSGYAFGGILTGWIADLSGGSFVVVVLVVAALVGILVIFLQVYYQEATTTTTTTTTTNTLAALYKQEDDDDDGPSSFLEESSTNE